MKNIENLDKLKVEGLNVFNYGDYGYNTSDEIYYVGDYYGTPIMIKSLFDNYIRVSVCYDNDVFIENLKEALSTVFGVPTVRYDISYNSNNLIHVIDWYCNGLSKVCTDLLVSGEIPFVSGNAKAQNIKFYYDFKSLNYIKTIK